VVRFTPWPIYPPGERAPRYPLDRRLSGPQGRSGRHRDVKILVPTDTPTLTPWSFSPQPAAIPTALSGLLPVIVLTVSDKLDFRLDVFMAVKFHIVVLGHVAWS
jgi:hypothetical protein